MSGGPQRREAIQTGSLGPQGLSQLQVSVAGNLVSLANL